MDIRFPIIPILIIIFTATLGIGIALGVFSVVKGCKRSRLDGDKTAKKWYVVIILCVVIMIWSWIFNLGWFRVILTWIPIPLIHTIAFLIINIQAAKRVCVFENFRKYIILSCATYLLAYLLFPDGGDVGGMYLFFTLIRNDTIARIMMYVTPIIFVANIAVLIFEYSELKKCKS